VDDRLVVQCEFSGTHSGPLLDLVPPTGKFIPAPGCMITRLDGSGRILEIWSYLNMDAPVLTGDHGLASEPDA
jgi:predicted ester cyclase